MALKGEFPFFNGNLPATNAYAVIDAVHIDKGGFASVHVSVYPRPPIDTVIVEQVQNPETKILEAVKIPQRDRGPVVEHFTCGGVDTRSQDAFVAAYIQLPKLDDRFKDMVSA